MKYIVWTFVGLFCQLFSTQTFSQDVRWTKFENLNDSIRLEAKPILIFIHADWCKFCEMQQNTTFKNESVVEVLNEEFYSLKLDGEQREDIRFMNRSYSYVSSGDETGAHELADFLGNEGGQLTYPTTVFLSKKMQVLGKKVGLVESDELLILLQKIK